MLENHVYTATSLDGFIARPDGSLDWLMQFDPAQQEYETFIAGMDGIVMGRSTYQTVHDFGDWPYTIPAVVLSTSLSPADVPAALRDKVEVSAQPVEALCRRLHAERGWRTAYVDGGRTVQSFLAAGLIAQMTIFTMPVLIGAGRPLFGPIDADMQWSLTECAPLAMGAAKTVWRRAGAAR
ncbi:MULTISPECIES: dihydrofolate reductase family protein [unclassified Roseitalea]|uniref:dihydrofolate reductase family protein n=1 Tax=unclassified Roseitalea TaxID=2639107 RepID=UPI00273FFA41|nr:MULTISPECIES: dihydrofolate reductase family protein [unclassified Roseitalea]